MTIFTYLKKQVKPITPKAMKRYYFKIKQNFNGFVDDQNVWTVASNKEEAYRNIEREYHSLIDIMCIRVTDYECE